MMGGRSSHACGSVNVRTWGEADRVARSRWKEDAKEQQHLKEADCCSVDNPR
jgi:hypothetical protein